VNPNVPVILSTFYYVVPEAILVLAACVLFFLATFRSSRQISGIIALGALGCAALAACLGLPDAPSGASLSQGILTGDYLAWFMRALALAGGAVLVLVCWSEVPDDLAAEYQACLLILTAGISLTGSANELITLFLALELISLPTYVILYLPRAHPVAQEAALKYFLLSIFSSALMLFGFSYLYGITGTTYLPTLFERLADRQDGELSALVPVALITIVAGLGFRITAVPFHFYAPDVYQGTSAGNAAVLAFAPKVAGFIALLRLTGYVWGDHASTPLALGPQVPMLFYILAAVSMSLGNLLALLQDNVKRLLAYSSVAHAGYMLIGFAVAPDLRSEHIAGGIDATLFYLVAYSAMTVGAFTVLVCLSRSGREVENMEDLAGLSSSHPGIALLMAIFLFSLIGIPLTAGFAGKLLLFLGALAAPAPREHAYLFKTLAVIGVLNAAVGAWYYLRILAMMYLRNPVKPIEKVRSSPALAALVLCAAVTLIFGGPYSATLHAFATRCVAPSTTGRALR
jgi:NADH-quinone oxidoreductase subunit N